MFLKKTFKYDDSGNLTEELEEEADGAWADRSVYAYDGQGRKTEMRQLDEAQKTLFRRTWTYDDAGRLTTEADFLPEGQMDLKTSYEYDAQGRLVRMRKFLPVQPGISVRYEYDDRGRRVRETRSNPQGSDELVRVYAYTPSDSVAEWSDYSGTGSLKGRFLWTYDVDGLKIREEFVAPESDTYYVHQFAYSKFTRRERKIHPEYIWKEQILTTNGVRTGLIRRSVQLLAD